MSANPTVDYQPYTTTHVVTILQLLLFAALAFVTLWKTGLYPPELRSVVLDVDWVWRRLLPEAWSGVSEVWLMGQGWFLSRAVALRRDLVGFTRAHLSPWTRFGEPWPSGTTAMWAAALLLAYLYLSY